MTVACRRAGSGQAATSGVRLHVDSQRRTVRCRVPGLALRSWGTTRASTRCSAGTAREGTRLPPGSPGVEDPSGHRWWWRPNRGNHCHWNGGPTGRGLVASRLWLGVHWRGLARRRSFREPPPPKKNKRPAARRSSVGVGPSAPRVGYRGFCVGVGSTVSCR